MEIQALDLWKRYSRTRVLRGACFSFRRGEVVALLGPSGSGKTTLLLTLLRLIPVDRGRILIDGEDLFRRDPKAYRRLLAYLPQHPEGSFNPRWSLGRSLEEPLRLLGLPLRRDRVLEVMERVGLSPGFWGRYPHQLSGGELQRAALARALLVEPRFLLADEPTAMLDPIRAANTMANLLHLVQKEKLGLLFTSHDPVLARRVAHRILLLQEGRILTQVATYPLGQKK